MNGFASYALFGSLVLYLIVGGIILWRLEYEHQGEEQQRKERRNLDCISMLKDVDKLLAFLQGTLCYSLEKNPPQLKPSIAPS